jgi:anti-sigma factor RsiW
MNMNEQQRLDELLGAFALNAIDDDERAQVDAYIERSPRAAAEVSEHLYVAAALAGSVSEIPAPSFDRISAAIDALELAAQPTMKPVIAPITSPSIAPTTATDTSSTVGTGGTTGTVIPMRRRRPVATWFTAVAAAAAIGALGFQNLQIGRDLKTSKVDLAAETQAKADLSSKLAASQAEASNALSVQRVMTSPGARIAPLTSGSKPIGRVLLDSNGRGFLELNAGETLAAGQAYQLWGVQDKKVISLGVMKSGLNAMPLSAAGEWSQFVLTVESLPGVVSSDGPAVAEGTFSF